MSDTKLNYLGPIPELISGPPRSSLRRRIPLAFVSVVMVPTLLAAIYFLLIATPRYVSESRFVVRAAADSRPQATGLGLALQGVGLTASNDAYAVHDYITSRDGIDALETRFNFADLLHPRGLDVFNGWPRFWEGRSAESLEKGLNRFVTIGHDASTGISVLRVEAFDPRAAQQINEAMLRNGEGLVNRLNDRQAQDAVTQARLATSEARTRLASTQQQLTAFRNREQFVDPESSASQGAGLIASLLTTVANLRAERAQIAAEAPASPQLAAIDSRINAFERQIEAERAKLAGASDSLASKLGAYEELVAQRELAGEELAQATAAQISAEQEARRQKLYLERIVSPSLPEKATAPNRWRAILTVFVSLLLIYAIGWLIWTGVREHRQT
ncbi:chain-length determining protein [Brevundimonas sp. UBA7534]|uniref:chain-length determining protein n=1 Tax=Brevundimonas sp. UBA7534 TaxID=1946138 RepID=UPI0025BF308F|nr:chain-length determining protein [Brevundimonas sp. UBA7534]